MKGKAQVLQMWTLYCKQRSYLFAMVQLGSGNATFTVLCKREIRVEGSRLVGVLPIPQPGHLPHGPTQLWSRLRLT